MFIYRFALPSTAAGRPRPERSAVYIRDAQHNANRQGSRGRRALDSARRQTHPPLMADDAELVVAGGGLVGMLLGIACAGAGLDVIVIDRQDPAAMLDERFDGRTSAIAYGSRLVFDGIGLWPGGRAQAEAVPAGRRPH